MSEVTLTIGGRKHTVACAAGEEAHITKLGESIDAKLQQMGTLTAPDSQNMLFAALLLADDLHELKSAVSGSSETQESLTRDREKAHDDAKTANGQLDALRTERDNLAEQLAELQKKQADQPAKTSLVADPDLAPALERFADLLENCADKLEGKAATS